MPRYVAIANDEYKSKRYSPNMQLDGSDIMGDKKSLRLSYRQGLLIFTPITNTVKYSFRNEPVLDKDTFAEKLDGRILLRAFSEIRPNYLSFVKREIQDKFRPNEHFNYHEDYSVAAS